MNRSANNKTDDLGLTFIEMLVSLALIAVMTITFVPIMVFALENTERNRMRTVATVLANEVIEEMRAMPFDEIGVIGGNPEGEIEPLTERISNGRAYRIEILVNWLELDEGSPFTNWDYKGVRVKVTPLGSLAGDNTTVSAQTNIARDTAQPAFTGANIRARVYRGWKEDQNAPNIPVGGVRVEIYKTYNVSAVTTDQGVALFINLVPGEYTVAVDRQYLGSHRGMIPMPGADHFTVNITGGSTAELSAMVERPCRLIINFSDNEGNPISISGTVILEKPFKDSDGNVITKEKQIINSSSVILTELWPVGQGHSGAYNLKISVEGFDDYNMSEDENPVWDGKFDRPDSTINITVAL